LQRQIERRPAGERAAEPTDSDPVTGLPNRSAALLAMQAASESGSRLYIAAMVVKGVQSVNLRFGFGVGDRMLRSFKESVERQLSSADKLFRWDGPALIVLMDRAEPIAQIRAQFKRILENRLEANYDVDGRSVLIPIVADSLTFSLMPPVALAVKQIQTFVAGQSSAMQAG
jgi:GGDEF domain-containing protein